MAKKALRLKQIQAGTLALLRPHTFIAVPPDPRIPAGAWKEAFAYAQRIHSALPFLIQIERASQKGAWGKSVSAEERVFLSEALHRDRMFLALLDWEMEKAGEVLARAKVPAIVLKGMDLARRFYPDRVFRPMSDIDLLVRARDFSKVVSRFESEGYQAVGRHYPGRFRIELCRDEGRPVVELHSFLLKGDDADSMKGIWKRAKEPENNPFPGTLVLGDEDHLFYLGAHAAVQHLIESPIWLNDIHFVLQNGEPDWDKLLKKIEQRRSHTAFWFLFTVLKAWGHTAPDDVIERLTAEVASGRRAALSVLAPQERLFPYAGRGWTWMLSGRFLLKDSALSAVRYAIERQLVTRPA